MDSNLDFLPAESLLTVWANCKQKDFKANLSKGSGFFTHNFGERCGFCIFSYFVSGLDF